MKSTSSSRLIGLSHWSPEAVLHLERSYTGKLRRSSSKHFVSLPFKVGFIVVTRGQCWVQNLTSFCRLRRVNLRIQRTLINHMICVSCAGMRCVMPFTYILSWNFLHRMYISQIPNGLSIIYPKAEFNYRNPGSRGSNNKELRIAIWQAEIASNLCATEH